MLVNPLFGLFMQQMRLRPARRPPVAFGWLPSAATVLDRYQPHLHGRWAEGCHDAAVLHAEITALGYRGSLRTVCRAKTGISALSWSSL